MRKRVQGSLTLEAALVLPIFLFFSLNVASLVQYFQMDSDRIAKQTEMAKNAAVVSYSLADGKKPGAADVFGLGRVEGNILFDENIDIYALHTQKPWIADIGYGTFHTLNRATCRKWTGYDPLSGQHGKQGEREELVYVSEKSEVYHKDPNCFHIDIRVHEISQKEIGQNRYTLCENCEKRRGYGCYYKTDGSEIYHTSLACKKIMRQISRITKGEAEKRGLPPCKDCGR